MISTFITNIFTPIYLSSPSSWTNKTPSETLVQFTSTALSTILSTLFPYLSNGLNHPSSRFIWCFSLIVDSLGLCIMGPYSKNAEEEAKGIVTEDQAFSCVKVLVDFLMTISGYTCSGYTNTFAIRRFTQNLSGKGGLDQHEIRTRRKNIGTEWWIGQAFLRLIFERVIINNQEVCSLVNNLIEFCVQVNIDSLYILWCMDNVKRLVEKGGVLLVILCFLCG